jgi:hypothetical protein
MSETTDLLDRRGRLCADAVMKFLDGMPASGRTQRLALGLSRVRPGLAAEVFDAARWYERQGHVPRAALHRALAASLTDVLQCEVARVLAQLDGHREALGLGVSPPDGKTADELDDLMQHNVPPNAGTRLAWEERQYRGLWWPAYMTPIRDLTPDDVGLAAAFLAGKLTQKGCPQSDEARRKQDSENFWWRIVHGVEMVAGMVASVVLGVIYGPLGGYLTGLLHRGKMALIDRYWKEKVINDPAVKMIVEKLQPLGRIFASRGFNYRMRPLGNMLVRELGCGADLSTRLLLHGRMIRTLDVLAASAPNAQPARGRVGLYDYPSSFGPLRGSIFPSRGITFDGGPPPPPVVKQVQAVMKTPAMHEAITRPAVSLSAVAGSLHEPPGPPPELARSAEAIRARAIDAEARAIREAKAERPFPTAALAAGIVLVGAVALAAST